MTERCPTTDSSNCTDTEFCGRRIYIAVRVIQIGQISECDQCFQARLDLFVEWPDEEGSRMSVEDLKTYKNKHWEPVIRFSNADEFVETNRLYMTWRSTGFVGYRSTVQGTFRVGFNFGSFPFDVQGLTIELTLGRERGSQEVLHVEKAQFRSAPNHANVMMKQCSAEWQFRPPRYRVKRTSALEGVDGASMAQFQLIIPVERMYSYYVYNVYIVSGLMVVMGFGVFAIEYDQVGDRTILSATLLLLIIALKFTVLSHQPNISYMTHLDKYMFFAYCMLIIQYAHSAAFVSVASLIHSDTDDIVQADINCSIAYVTVFMIFQVFFFVTAWRALAERTHMISSFGRMDQALQKLLTDQGYEIKGGVLKGTLKFDDGKLDLPEDTSAAALDERNRALGNSWTGGAGTEEVQPGEDGTTRAGSGAAAVEVAPRATRAAAAIGAGGDLGDACSVQPTSSLMASVLSGVGDAKEDLACLLREALQQLAEETRAEACAKAFGGGCKENACVATKQM